ncbi:MAG: 4-(cytidine 5'-diphospho)-2-C-methyl-D-erythritol kinase [Alphaproteobacteria bacterium]|nr:4-(cytidine 5'-diphospho)-2-C-methyl-D-erythritol kinase [Alphaproteobacteria bacterium]
MSVRVFAPAKINLTLEVGRARADGYHPLQSAVVFAGEGDWVEAQAADALTLTITGPFAPELEANENNLVLRAARLLDPARNAALKLEKNLPIASGIGGGSSDAAATLLALNELWNLGLSRSNLSKLAATLGADVPVCVYKHPAWISGVGDAVTPMRAPTLHGVLVNPGKPLSTPLVYRRFDELALGAAFKARGASDWTRADDVIEAVTRHGNDLEAPAVALMPELDDVLSILRADARVLCAGLSGSGATCFALAGGAQEASGVAAELGARNRDWWVRATTFGGA